MDTINFLAGEIKQGDLVNFSETKVNLSRDHASRYREQVNRLRKHLDRYISENPDVGLVKMLLSGSLAKGTALKTINDVDVALYVKGGTAPQERGELLEWIAERLRNTYTQMDSKSIYVDDPAVVISFAGTGIDVDVVPIYYDGDKEWRGYLWDKWTGQKILTSIPQHLEFIRKRKEKQNPQFAQVIRLLKWWAKQREREDNSFSMRSFLIELIVAKLSDLGKDFSDYQVGIEHFFLYIQQTGLKERITFSDFYPDTKLPSKRRGMVEIIDPVNPDNNVASDMTENQRGKLVTFSEQALDALSYAKTCQTKGEALECWQEVMGASFTA